MRIIGVHLHRGTRRSYPLQSERELAQQRATWSSETRHHTAAEMAAYLHARGVAAILDLGCAKHRPIEEMRARHDYAFATEAAYPDVIIGHYLDPQRTPRASQATPSAFSRRSD